MLLWRKNVFYPIPLLQTSKCWTSSDVGAVSDLHQPSCREVLELYPTSLKTKDPAEGGGVVLLDGRRINLGPERPPKVFAVERAFLPSQRRSESVISVAFPLLAELCPKHRHLPKRTTLCTSVLFNRNPFTCVLTNL
ncbi:unnamed protein product [Tenebrio molitor]|nr:unnamed protein product [Tenebrio molitor]